MRTLLICIFLLPVMWLSAQEAQTKIPNLPGYDQRPLHFGFLIGLNAMDFRVTHKSPSDRPPEYNNRYSEVVNLNPGLNLGVVSSLRLNRFFHLRFLPGISFGQRDLWFTNQSTTDQGEVVSERDDRPQELKSTFLEFPLLLKFSGARMTNVKPYLVGGINPRIDLAKSKKDGLLLKSTDLYVEFGAGLDMYLTYFRLSTEAKMSIGLRNMLDPAGTGEPEDVKFTGVLDRLTSRLFVFTFYFE